MDKRKENHQLFLRDMAEQNYKMSARPLELMIGLTNVCNLQCVFCPYCGICTKKIEKKSEISLQNIENLGRTFFETAEFLNPSLRGEPFLYTYFKQFMQLCSKSGILQRTQLINNGTKLDKYDLKKLEGINIISISFDGATQEVFEALRTGANFYQVLSNMERLRRELPETVLQITVVVCRLNLHQLADIYAIAREKGFNYITFNTIYGPETDKVIQLLRLRESDRELLSEQLEKISKLNMDHKMTVMDVTSFDGYDDEIPLDCQKIMEELKELRKAEPYLDFDGERDISHPERRIHYERQNAFPYIYIYIWKENTTSILHGTVEYFKCYAGWKGAAMLRIIWCYWQFIRRR